MSDDQGNDDPSFLPFDVRAAQWIDEVFGGLHRIKLIYHTDFVEIDSLRSSLATYDDDLLTKMVLASHWLCVRAEIHSSKKATVQIYLHPRTHRIGRYYQRHPCLAELTEYCKKMPITIAHKPGCLNRFNPRSKGPLKTS